MEQPLIKPNLSLDEINELITLSGIEWVENAGKAMNADDESSKQYYRNKAKKYKALMDKLDFMYGVLQNE